MKPWHKVMFDTRLDDDDDDDKKKKKKTTSSILTVCTKLAG